MSDIGRDPEPVNRPLGPAVKRTVAVTLELLDLQESFSAWESRVERNAKKRIEFHAPEFHALLEDCLQSLIPKLIYRAPEREAGGVY